MGGSGRAVPLGAPAGRSRAASGESISGPGWRTHSPEAFLLWLAVRYPGCAQPLSPLHTGRLSIKRTGRNTGRIREAIEVVTTIEVESIEILIFLVDNDSSMGTTGAARGRTPNMSLGMPSRDAEAEPLD